MDVLTCDQLLLVMASIDTDPRRGWAMRARIVQLIGRYPGGVEIGRDTIAHYIGARSQGHVGDLLVHLVTERVLIVVSPPAGSRAGVYRVNPSLGEWRRTDSPGSQRVPWIRPWRDVAASLFPVEPSPAGDDSVCRPVHGPADNGGVVGRSARRPARVSVAGRSMDRPTTGAVAGRSMDRPTTGAVAGRSMDRPTKRRPPRVGIPPSSVVDDSTSSSSSFEEEREAAGRGESIELRAIAAAVQHRCGAKFLRGEPRRLLAELLDLHPLDTIRDAIAIEEPGSVVIFVTRLADRLAALQLGISLDSPPPAPEPAPPSEVPADVQARADEAVRLIAWEDHARALNAGGVQRSEAYAAACRQRADAEHGDAARMLATTRPDWDPERIAAHLTRPVRGSVPAEESQHPILARARTEPADHPASDDDTPVIAGASATLARAALAAARRPTDPPTAAQA